MCNRLCLHLCNYSEIQRVRVTLWIVVYRQSVRLGTETLVDHYQRFFLFQLNPCGHSPYVTSSLMRGWICLLWICLALSSVRITHTACYWKFFLLHYIQVLCQSRLLQSWSCLSYLSYATMAASPPSSSSLLYFLCLASPRPTLRTSSFSCLLPAQFCYIIVYIWKVESCVQIADRYAP
jgi:hypothetical protein